MLNDSKRPLRWIAVAALYGAAIVGLMLIQRRPDDNCFVDAATGVQICWPQDATPFPASMTAPPVSAFAIGLSPAEHDRPLGVVQMALRRYPPRLLQQRLRTVYLLKTLRFRGVDAGSTYSDWRGTIFMAHCGYGKKQFGAVQLQKVFHAEFSSILLYSYPQLWNAAAWQACNAPRFQYGRGSNAAAIKSGQASQNPNSATWKAGLYSQWAAVSPEEDFNTVVEILFVPTPISRAALAVSPRLKRKADLVRAFYHKLGVAL